MGAAPMDSVPLRPSGGTYFRSVLAAAVAVSLTFLLIALAESALRGLRLLPPATWPLALPEFALVAGTRALAVFLACAVSVPIAGYRPLGHGLVIGLFIAGIEFARLILALAIGPALSDPLVTYPLALTFVAIPAACLAGYLLVASAGSLPRVLFHTALVLASVVPVAAILAAPAWLQEGDADWDHIASVPLEDGRVARFSGPVKFFFDQGRDADRALLTKVVTQLNYLTAGGAVRWSGVEQWNGDSPVAAVVIRFMSRVELNATAPEFAGALGLAQRNGTLNIEGAEVAVRRDLRGVDRAAVVLHEVAHAIGLVGHSSYRRRYDSLMAAQGGAMEVEFTPLDRKTIRFLYQHLQSGDGPAEVRRAFDAHWRDTPDS